jgi:hypothetical protein
MQWTQLGAHLLLQIRTRVLNEEWEDTFRSWYPASGQKPKRNHLRKPLDRPESNALVFERQLEHYDQIEAMHHPAW